METAYLQTPIGWARIEGDEEGIRSVIVLDEAPRQIPIIPEILEDAVYQLREYFKGKRHRFDLKLNPEGTPFQQKVWEQLSEIPFGKTLSYLDLSRQLGDPNAIRAVAAANAKNPLWVIIPCHRVVGSDGSLTGYAGGLHRKKWLLDHEQGSYQQLLF
ncbi:methylated-DNA--[protein]-cysteine S-methyltransferase [Lentiprolixibacter aurantiacus]|uniref:Methylated-DNA--protein-cysteine methyltransferase n=1 Tax=Lentiprolixibacter aurantiacus TaxID=2993939 RepID=A0AAE3MKN4_9FLAO|nr:methylated-DNA--[protein]-cysteine S-methyltransferase [Lentiprolixibacter aurantiacus]MCX2718659.1 methylated-DNA--[protein]-cysteine S-methyltransferase [Lentiprolixibacter aurantiacus]